MRTSAGSDQDTRQRRWDRRATVAAAVIVAVGGVFAALITAGVFSGGKPPAPSGVIESPVAGATVDRAFTVQGATSHIASDAHVWLAVQVGNLLYPKDPEVEAHDGSFARDIVEGGDPPGGVFTLVLMRVGSDGQHAIETWLAGVAAGASPQAMTTIPGQVVLDAVPDLHLSSTASEPAGGG